MALNEILYIVAVGFSVGLSVITTVVATKKSKQTEQVESGRNSTENGTQSVDGNTKDTKVKNFWGTLAEKLPSYIVSAEQFYNQLVGKASGIKTGAQKLAQVLDKIKIDCLTSGVEYDEQKATDMVNNLVDLTNQVNTNK